MPIDESFKAERDMRKEQHAAKAGPDRWAPLLDLSTLASAIEEYVGKCIERALADHENTAMQHDVDELKQTIQDLESRISEIESPD